MKRRSLPHADDWVTPKWFYDLLNAEFHFDFDPCPLGGTGGLECEWGARNFVNPPYSRKLKETFVRKAVEEARSGKLCVLLLPVSTSTALFHDVILPNAKEIRFVRGRIAFAGYNTRGEYVTTRKGMHDSMVVVVGEPMPHRPPCSIGSIEMLPSLSL